MTDDALAELVQLMPPPAGRVARIDWRRVEAELGTPLPPSYKALVDTYGAGAIDDFLWLYSPDTIPTLDLLARARSEQEALRSVRGDPGHEIFGELIPPAPWAVPYPIFPERGGLLAWAGTDNGDVIYWRTIGAPEDWEIVVAASRLGSWSATRGPVAAWLVRLLRGAERMTMFPNDFPSTGAAFSSAPGMLRR